MKGIWIAAVGLPLLCCSPAFAQIDDPLTAVPSLSATSPLGIGPQVSRRGRNPAGRHRTLVTRSQSDTHHQRNGHNWNTKHRCNHKRRHDMFGLRSFAVGNVRIHSDL